MDNFDLRKYLAEGRLLKEDFPNQKYYDLLNDLRDEGLLNKSGISGLQSKFNLSKEKAKEIFDEYLEDLEAEQPDAFDFFMRDLNEEKLTPLQQYVFNYEKDISGEVDSDALQAIKGMKNVDDVYDYYAYERGWEDDEDLEDDLENIYTQVKVKFGEGKLNEFMEDSGIEYYLDEIRRDLEELDVKEGNDYLEDLARAILKLKR